MGKRTIILPPHNGVCPNPVPMLHSAPMHPCLLRHPLLIALTAILVASCSAPAPQQNLSSGPQPTAIADPFERVNRGIWEFNEALLEGVVLPSTTAYHNAVPQPARKSIGHFSRNLGSPSRFLNQVLQGRWQDAGNETVRFATNSTVGVAGLFDVASKWDIPSSNSGFAQTIQTWGWNGKTYLVLPLFGPSDETHATGRFLDEATEPWNFFPSLRTAATVTNFDKISNIADRQVLLIRTQPDPYSIARLAWTYSASETTTPDLTLRGPIHPPTLQTLGVATLENQDPAFYKKGRTAHVRIPSTQRRLPYNLWLQKTPAPLVYISPGLASHRLSGITLSLAESLFRDGFSVVSTSGIFHPEFMENASTTATPGDPARDSADLLQALTEIDRTLAHKHPKLLTRRALVGLSMGGFETLRLAATEKSRAPNTLTFDRYLAIHSPVDLQTALKTLDQYYHAPNAWPQNDRVQRIDNTFHKVATLARQPGPLPQVPPFEAIESKYLVGYSFRMILRDTLFSIHSRYPSQHFTKKASHWERDSLYQEMLNTSFQDYQKTWLLPNSPAGLTTRTNLRSLTTAITRNPRVRAIVNRNDFLLGPGHLSWYQSTLGSRLKTLPQGGHLSNIAHPDTTKAIHTFLKDLK